MSQIPGGRQIPFRAASFAPAPLVAPTNVGDDLSAILTGVIATSKIATGAIEHQGKIELDEAQAALQIQRVNARLDQVDQMRRNEVSRINNVKKSLKNKEAAEQYDELVRLERGKVPAYFATLSPDEQEDFLRTNPIFTKENEEYFSELFGNEIAMRHRLEIMGRKSQQIREAVGAFAANPQDFDAGRADILGQLDLHEEVAQLSAQMQGMPDSVIGAWSKHLMRGLHGDAMRMMEQEAKEMQANSENTAVLNLESEVQLMLSGEGMFSDFSDPATHGGLALAAFAGAHGMTNEQGQQVLAGMVRRSIIARLNQGDSPEKLKRPFKDIDGRTVLGKELDIGPEGTMEEIFARGQEDFQARADNVFKRRITSRSQDLARARDLTGLQNLKTTLLPEIQDDELRKDMELQIDGWIHQTGLTIEKVNNAELALLGKFKVSDVGTMTTRQQNFLYRDMQEKHGWTPEQALTNIAREFHFVPSDAAKEIETMLDGDNVLRDVRGGLSQLRSIRAGDPVLADEMGDGLTGFGEMAFSSTRYMAEDSTELAVAVEALQASGANYAYQRGLAFITNEDSGLPGQSESQRLQMAPGEESFIFNLMAQRYPMLSQPSQRVQRAFRNDLLFGFVKAAAGNAPIDKEATSAIGYATSRNQREYPVVRIQGGEQQMTVRGELGVTILNENDKKWLGEALGNYQSAQLTDAENFARTDAGRVRDIDGKTYFPSYATDIDAEHPGPSFVGALEVDISSRETKMIEPDAFGGQLKRIFEGDMPESAFHYLGEFTYPEASNVRPFIQDYTDRYGSALVTGLRTALTTRFRDTFSRDPDMTEPDDRDWMIEQVAEIGWSGWQAPVVRPMGPAPAPPPPPGATP